jgi:hypothetical protein
VSRREKSRTMIRAEARLFERLISDAPEQWLALFHPIWPDIESTQALTRAPRPAEAPVPGAEVTR